MRALTHLFGSVDGYRTLARSPGIGDAEDAALAAMGFGSPQRADEFDQLDHTLCAAGRPLPGGRYAITRLFKAGLDVAGRQTVERRTLVLAPEQWASLASLDLQALLTNETVWRREAFAEGAQVSVPTMASDDLWPQASETDRRAYDALLSARSSGRCAMLPAESRFQEAVLRLPRLLPTEESVSLGWGVGLWSIPSGVSLATVRELARQRNAFPAPTAGAWRHPERIEALGSREVPRPRLAEASRQPSRSRDLRWLPWVTGAAVLTMLIGALLLIWRTTAPEQPAKQPVPPPPIFTPTPPPVAPAPTPPAPPAPAPTPQSPRDDDRPGFGSAPGAGAGFGQESPDAVPAAAPANAPAAPAPVAPATPTLTPPPAPPVIPPPPPPQSTSWDEEVQVLRECVDLVQTINAATSRPGEPDASLVALAERLKDRAEDLTQRARRCLESDRPERIFTFDAKGGGPGLAEALRTQVGTGSGALPAGTVRCIALLAARFQLRVAASDIQGAIKAHPSLQQQPQWKSVVNQVEGVREWPKTPFSTWYAAGEAPRKDLATIAAARAIVGRLAADLPQAGGMQPLIQELKRAEASLPQELQP